MRRLSILKAEAASCSTAQLSLAASLRNFSIRLLYLGILNSHLITKFCSQVLSSRHFLQVNLVRQYFSTNLIAVRRTCRKSYSQRIACHTWIKYTIQARFLLLIDWAVLLPFLWLASRRASNAALSCSMTCLAPRGRSWRVEIRAAVPGIARLKMMALGSLLYSRLVTTASISVLAA